MERRRPRLRGVRGSYGNRYGPFYQPAGRKLKDHQGKGGAVDAIAPFYPWWSFAAQA